MSDLRKEFEALLKVSEIIGDHSDELIFNEDKNEYETPIYKTFIPEYVCEINFGWYIFQEQKKKINKALRYIDRYLTDSEFKEDLEELLK